MAKYFLFGSEACKAIAKIGTENDITHGSINYEIYKFDSNSHPADILEMLNDWKEYTEINEQQYAILAKNKIYRVVGAIGGLSVVFRFSLQDILIIDQDQKLSKTMETLINDIADFQNLRINESIFKVLDGNNPNGSKGIIIREK